MKRIAVAVLSVIMLMVMGACGQASPSDNAKIFLDAVKTKDFDAMVSVCDGEADTENGFDDLYDDLYEDMPKEFVDKVMDVLFAYDYEIKGEEIDGDKAVVFVDMKCLPAGDAIRNIDEDEIYEKFLDEYGTLIDNGYDIPDDEIEEFYADYIADLLDDLSEKTFEDTIELQMVKTDEGWKVADLDENSDFLYVLGGGFGAAVEDM